jgi:hypothetical protein
MLSRVGAMFASNTGRKTNSNSLSCVFGRDTFRVWRSNHKMTPLPGRATCLLS